MELEENAATQEEAEVFELDPFDTLVGQDGEEFGSDEDDNEDSAICLRMLVGKQTKMAHKEKIYTPIFITSRFNHTQSSPPVSTSLSSLPSSSLDLKSTTPTSASGAGWRDLVENEEDPDEFALGGVTKKWMAPLGVIQQVITSELNPLKICSVNVVMQFARVAHATDFIYCYSIMEANKRSEYAPNMPMSRSSQSSMRRQAVHPSMLGQSMTAELNMFFPFDPYKLPKSGAYIQGVYREWSSVAIGAEEDDDEDDDEESVGSEEPAENELPQGIAMSGARSPAPDDEAANSGASFGGMSMSPSVPRMTSLPAS
ncbi:RNA polymerase I-specific transcription initiation factor RRN3-domain-containing protein [Amylocystis lapponica]|nr:RNA polymerase I-specific transcription initiation factor RRN3-domain-containing protein [Amylocystis lapponica]